MPDLPKQQAPHFGSSVRISTDDYRNKTRHSPFHLLENIQDEVHRFAITFHRDKRSKSQIASALDGIKGIGEKRKTALLKEFKSVARIKQATVEELAAVIGEAAAKSVKEAL